MHINKKDDSSTKLSFKKAFLQTESKERNRSSPLENNLKEKYFLTAKDLDNRQKLIDFISDKKKFSFKSAFDHKGTKSFLSDKEVAFKRIELNENIEIININDKEDKSIKKIRHRRSADYYLENNEVIIKQESIKKKKHKKHKSISTKIYGSKLDNIKDKFMDFELEKLLWEPKSPTNKRKTKKLREKKKTKNNLINLINLDKSINSIETIEPKNNNNKEYDKTRDDDPLIKEILNELDVTKK